MHRALLAACTSCQGSHGMQSMHDCSRDGGMTTLCCPMAQALVCPWHASAIHIPPAAFPSPKHSHSSSCPSRHVELASLASGVPYGCWHPACAQAFDDTLKQKPLSLSVGVMMGTFAPGSSPSCETVIIFVEMSYGKSALDRSTYTSCKANLHARLCKAVMN